MSFSILVVSALVTANPSLGESQWPALTLAAPYRGTLSGSGRHTHKVRLQANYAYVVEVQQNGLDLIVAIGHPDGKRQVFNSPMLRQESERILLEPDNDGLYVIELKNVEDTDARANYVLEISVVRSESSALALDALRAETRAAAYYNVGGAAAWQSCIDSYREALATWQELGEKQAEARATFALARVYYWDLTDWPATIREAASSAAIYGPLGNRSMYASSLHLQAAAMIESTLELRRKQQQADTAGKVEALFEEALQLLLEAESIKSEVGEEYERARIINDIGLAYDYRGSWDDARARYRQAAALFHAEREWAGELIPMMNLGVIDYKQGRLVSALESYRRVLELVPADRPVTRAHVLDNMAAAYNVLGRIDEALAYYFEALELHEARGEKKSQARSLSGIGVTYYRAGDLQRARQYFEVALPLRRSVSDARGLVSTLQYHGNVNLELGNIETAIRSYQEAASLATSDQERASAWVLLAQGLATAERSDEALNVLMLAVEASSGTETPLVQANALVERSAIYRESGHLDEAGTDAAAALRIYEDLRVLAGQARAHMELARLARQNEHFDAAADHAEESLDFTERLRRQITSPELRATYFATRLANYHFYIDLLMTRFDASGATRYLEAALQTSERRHSRTIVDLVTESAVDIAQGIDPKLRQKQQFLYDKLAELRYRQGMLMGQGTQSSSAADVLAALHRTETEIDLLEAEIRNKHPRFGELTNPRLMNLQAIQSNLDAETLLVEYVLGEPKSYVFVVTTDSVEGYALASGKTIEELARTVHENLKHFDTSSAATNRRSKAMREFVAAVLTPISDRLTKPRVLIVPDGAMHYVPFAALPVDTIDGGIAPLLFEHEIVNIPSISFLAAQRRAGRPTEQAHQTIAVFADPVFSRNDPRFKNIESVASAADPAPWTANHLSSPGSDLVRLPGTSMEATIVSEFVPANQRLIAEGFAANRKAVVTGNLGNYRIIHLATHGLVDTRYPALSALALSAFDATGWPEDGMLRVHDIYNLSLNAELVVLSACDTALGREIRGEGLIGMTGGFFYAGARSVVATLWQVPDTATAEYMKKFYEKLLIDGLPVTAAIRETQRFMARERRWRDPHFWAAFVVQGDWQQSQRSDSRMAVR